MKKITSDYIENFRKYLLCEEKADATIAKYCRDINALQRWLSDEEVNKENILRYKKTLCMQYAPASVNSIISSLNAFFVFAGWHECKIKVIKIQRKVFAEEGKSLSKEEYEKLLEAAEKKKNLRLYFLIQTICATGIRVSELKFITVSAIKRERATINCKGKLRTVVIPVKLCKALKKYTLENNIKEGPVFVSRRGVPLDRSNIWNDMKKLCAIAGVDRKKVFPHNLRHLFAKTYYSIEKDVVRLADILGHSSIDTTRIYTMESELTYRKQLERLELLFLGKIKTT